MTEVTQKQRLGILIAGHVPDELQSQFGRYDRFFIDLLGADSFEYSSYAVCDGEFPDSVLAADGWLISGSRHGVYEQHDWIPPLEELVRTAYKKGVPLVGICFGHQILAQALGGKVEKFAGGWSVGRVRYDLSPEFTGRSVQLHAWHQDQVVGLPEDAEVLGSSDICQYAMLRYSNEHGNRALGVQPHPEFADNYVESLLDTRGSVLPEELRLQARESLCKPLDGDLIAEQIRSFFAAS